MRNTICILAALFPAVALGAQQEWTGGTNVYALASNWTSAIPNDNDTALFLSADVTAGVAGVDMNTIGLTALIVGPNFDTDANIGTWSGSSLTTPLEIGASSVIIRGGGDIGLHPGSASNEYANVLVDSSVSTQTIEFRHDNDASTVGITMLITDGDVTLTSGYYREVFLDPATGDAPTLTIGSAYIKTLWLYGGTVTMTGDGDIGTLHQAAGTTTISDGQVVTLYQDAGTFYWHTTDTLTLLQIAGGTFSSAADPRAKTITTVRALEGAIIDIDNGVPDSVTLTNDIETLGNITFRTPGKQVIKLQ